MCRHYKIIIIDEQTFKVILNVLDKPKRIKKAHNSLSTKRKLNKIKRQAGLQYVGFSVKGNKMKQDAIRMPRAMGSPCTSPFCAKSRLRHCKKFRHDIRWIIFTSFWQI